MRVGTTLFMLSFLFCTIGSAVGQEEVTADQGNMITWDKLADEYGVKDRKMENKVVAKIVKDDPMWGSGYLMSGKDNSSFMVAPRQIATASGGMVSVSMFGGEITDNAPDEAFYDALGVGTSLDLPDQWLRIFGVEVKGGSIKIKESGIEFFQSEIR